MTIAGVTNVADWNEARGVTVPLAAEDATERAHVVENFMAGKPTYGPDSKVGGGSNIFIPPAEVDVTSRYPGVELLTATTIANDPTWGNDGSAKPITPMTPGEYVVLSDGVKMHITPSGWGSRPTPVPGDLSRRWTELAASADLAAAKAHPVFGDEGTGSPNDPSGPDPAFKSGEFVVLADMTMAYWNGDVWLAGKAP